MMVKTETLQIQSRDKKVSWDFPSLHTALHRVPKKGSTKLMAVTLSNLNQFSKFFYHWKEKEIFNKTHVLFPTTP